MYLSAVIIPSIWTNSPTPVHAKRPYTIMLLPPCFTVFHTFLSISSSPVLFHTLGRCLLPNSWNLISSVQRTQLSYTNCRDCTFLLNASAIASSDTNFMNNDRSSVVLYVVSISIRSVSNVFRNPAISTHDGRGLPKGNRNWTVLIAFSHMSLSGKNTTDNCSNCVQSKPRTKRAC